MQNDPFEELRWVPKGSQLVSSQQKICFFVSDGDRRLWTFDLKQYELVMERFQGLKPNVVLEGIHKKVLDIFREESRPDEGSMLSYMASISEPLRESLLPFQKEGVK